MNQTPSLNEFDLQTLHDLQQRLLMSTKTSRDLASLLQTHALNLEHCAALVETLLSPSGTPVSESLPTSTTDMSWRMPGPKDTRDTLTKKLNHALTELQISRAPPPASGSQDSIPSLAEAVRILDESNRQFRSDDPLKDIKYKKIGRQTSSVKRKTKKKQNLGEEWI